MNTSVIIIEYGSHLLRWYSFDFVLVFTHLGDLNLTYVYSIWFRFGIRVNLWASVPHGSVMCGIFHSSDVRVRWQLTDSEAEKLITSHKQQNDKTCWFSAKSDCEDALHICANDEGWIIIFFTGVPICMSG